MAPDDFVPIDRNCHKSHHYAAVLAGSRVAYLDSYSIDEFSMYGAIPLVDIKRTLLTYRREGRLDRVTLISLTNCTFDGVVYDVERVMTECLAIKPDLAFLWDEAWFAFARFHPVYRRRTAMAAAARLSERFGTAEFLTLRLADAVGPVEVPDRRTDPAHGGPLPACRGYGEVPPIGRDFGDSGGARPGWARKLCAPDQEPHGQLRRAPAARALHKSNGAGVGRPAVGVTGLPVGR
ncbi:hypothetical protein ACWGR4_39310 [Embleya sp. NPDC055664]